MQINIHIDSEMKSSEVSIVEFDEFITYHRDGEGDGFGNNSNEGVYSIDGFEVFSTMGMKAAFGPVKTGFYVVGFNLTGSVAVEINLNRFVQTPHTIHFKSPDKIFSLSDPSPGFYGYYLIFTQSFIEKVVPAFNQMQRQFPFLSSDGMPVFELNPEEANEVKDLFLKMESELRRNVPNREWMLGTYLFQLFITGHRSYTRQQVHLQAELHGHHEMLDKFISLVKQHYKLSRSVSEYAQKLNVTPNHLNRLIKQQSGKTASAIIQETLLLEAKTLLKYTDKSISEIAFELQFTDSAHFTHFFKQATGVSPKQYRS